MVPKPEYGDLHRWKVSIGVLLIFASMAIPWVVLREPFNLIASTQQVEELKGLSRTFFRVRQWLEISLSVFSVIAVPLCLTFGIRYLRQGLKGWSQLQEKFDRDQLADNQKVDEALPEATPEEISKGAGIDPAQEAPASDAFPDFAHRELRTVEERFGAKLRASFTDLYEVLDSRRVGKSVVDFLLLAKERPTPDLLIEVKFMGLPILRRDILAIIEEYLAAADAYEAQFDRFPIVHLFIVSSSVPNLTGDELFVREAAFAGKFPMRVHFMSRSAFGLLSQNQIKNLLGRTRESGTTWTP
jgi:hypothetical protein